MPWIVGMDVAGVVDEVGPDGDGRLAEGGRVTAIVVPWGSHGGYREQIVLPAAAAASASVVPVPTGVELPEASSLPVSGLTARLALA